MLVFMDSLNEKLKIDKERVVDLLLLTYALVGTPVILLSMLRISETGMRTSLWAQLSAAIFLIVISFFRARLPYNFKVLILVSIPWLLGILGIYSFGLVDGSVMLLFASSITAATLGGVRLGLISTVLSALVASLIAIAALKGFIVFDVDANLYMYQKGSWIVFISAFFALSAISVLVLGKTTEIAYEALEDLESEKQKLTEANYTKDKLFQLIAHDLRSPFQGLISGLELFADQDLEAFDEQQRKKLFLSMLRDSNSTFSMLENLLYWSRTQTGDLDVDLKFVDLQTLISNSAKSCQRQLEQKNIKLEIESPIGVYAYCDERSIQIVLINLISNAVKFTDSGGKILIKVSTSSEKGKVAITVKDSGIGVATKYRDKLFDTKQYFSTRGTQNEGGTGLGLSISVELAQLNNGSLHYEDNDWQGASFVLTLPTQSS